MLKLNVGNPILVTTDMGPVINRAAVKRIDGMVNDAVAGGAQLIAGGKPLTDGEFAKGSYYAPTLLDNVTSDMRVGQEEPFAPLAPVFRWGAMKRRSRSLIPLNTDCRRASLRKTSREL